MKICLNMIVKNEAPVIRRCLDTVKPWIDHWVIVDTGSGDGTQDIIRECMAGIPGELHERPWKNFAHNRNEAMSLAKPHADYLLFIDADETLAVPPGFAWPSLGAAGYRFSCSLGDWNYQRNALVTTRDPWRWEGVLHEYLTQNEPHVWDYLPDATIVVSRDGARARDAQTYERDIQVLEQAVRDNPGDTRYRFYLAQSYRDAGRIADSIRAYRERHAMDGWDEERWYSLYQIASLIEMNGAPRSEIIDAYLDAFQARPTRAEPLYHLARYHRQRGEYVLAHLFASRGVALPRPADALFVDESVYRWRMLDELAVSAWYAGAVEEGRVALRRLLEENFFPPEEAGRIVANKAFFGL
ncbi:glycosyltransferase family 2 protein [Paraburkholderia sp. J67]|uniref:glycosyltransferase family 2 protein n=1 Tax=Paraburkholderia sp. J67 TaxID=2805435 RepID=UPI002ABD9B98|nr:glycosyltransferase family 2 protein [Paraburkholderia sp. J67]